MADKRRLQGGSTGVVLALLAFALMCTSVLLASFASSSSAGSQSVEPNREPVSCLRDNDRKALQETTAAHLALRDNNFGAAQVHIQRARVRLEAAVVEAEEGETCR